MGVVSGPNGPAGHSKIPPPGKNGTKVYTERKPSAINVAIGVPLAGGWQTLKIMDLKVLTAFSHSGAQQREAKVKTAASDITLTIPVRPVNSVISCIV
jgi:hypothetical protein